MSITNSWSLPKFMSIESVMPSNHIILCRPLLLLPSIFPNIRVFSNESALHIRWPKYWSFSFNINPSSEHPGLISLRMDWLDLLAVQGTLKSLLQHHSSKASVLLHSALFMKSSILNPRAWVIRLIAGYWGFPGGSDGKESACNAGHPGLILGRKDPLGKGKATHSSILGWRIPWTEELSRLLVFSSVHSLSRVQLFVTP